LKKLAKSNHHSREETEQIINQTIGEDTSDIAKRTLLTCQTALSNTEEREKIW